MKLRLWIWIGFLRVLQPVAIAQNRQSEADINRMKARADLYFREAAYEKAIRIYQLCVSYPGPGDKQPLKAQVQKAKRLVQLNSLLFADIRKSNYTSALKYSQEMLRLNPNDPYIKATQKDLSQSATQQFSTQDNRLLNRADILIKARKWADARAILRLIDQLPNGRKNAQVATKLEMVGELEAAEGTIAAATRNGDFTRAELTINQVIVKYPDEAKNIGKSASTNGIMENSSSLRKQLFELVAQQISQCNYDKAVQLLIDAKTKGGLTNDLQVSNKISAIRLVERQRQSIIYWKNDPSKRTITLQAYRAVYSKKEFRACVRESYYEYLTADARVKQNGSNYAGAILSYKAAISISPVLAKKEHIGQQLIICDSLSRCSDREQVFISLIRTADQLYQQCNCDSAINVWQSAKRYISPLCPTNDINLAKWTDWQNKEADCKKEKNNIGQFFSLLANGEELLSVNSCQQSKEILLSASAIKARCSQFSKKRLDSLLAKCDVCLKTQCYDSLMIAAERSYGLGFEIDALKYYRQARECEAKKNDGTLARLINELTCRVEGKGCSPSVIKPVKISKNSVTVEFTVGGGGIIANFTEQVVQLPISYTNHQRISITAKYLPERSIFSGGGGFYVGRYQMNVAKLSANTSGNLSILDIGPMAFLRLHSPAYKTKNWYPYLLGGYTITKPVLFKFEDTDSNKSLTGTNYISPFFKAVMVGAGIEINSKKTTYKIELLGQIVNQEIFKNTSAPGYNTSLQGINNISVNVGIGFR